jgi:hypothetical protein
MFARPGAVAEFYYKSLLNMLREEIHNGIWKTRWGGGVGVDKAKKITHSMSRILEVIKKAEELVREAPENASLIYNHLLVEIHQTILKDAVNKNADSTYNFWHGRDEVTKAFYERWEVHLRNIKPISFKLTMGDPSIDTAGLTIYSARHKAFVERRDNQNVMSMAEVINHVHHRPFNEEVAFIYVIDKRGQLRFSHHNDSTYHVNIHGGAAALGAGEMYMRKTSRGIELSRLNNRSGCYLPGTSFFGALFKWFKGFGIFASKTKITDEKVLQKSIEAENNRVVRWSGRGWAV